jgi:hypothetical protein
MTSISIFAAVFCALYAAHSFGDHWVQSHRQAGSKGQRTRPGARACLAHVATLTVTKAVALGLLMVVTGFRPAAPEWLGLGLLVDAVSHYWADRRYTLAWLAERIGKGGFYRLGMPEVAPTGTGAYALDQSWHHAWLFVTALIIAWGSA